MGVSTNAILFFGFDTGEEEPWNVGREVVVDDNLDLEDVAMRGSGIQDPRGDLSDDAFEGWYKDPENKASIHAYWAARRDYLKAQDCEIGQHCSGEYPMYFVAVSSTIQTAYRGDCVEVSLELDEDAAKEKLRKFCERAGLVYQTPKWRMVSWWSQ